MKKRIYIFGQAGYGKWAYYQLNKDLCEPCAFIDKNYEKIKKEKDDYLYCGLECIGLSELKDNDFDYVLIAQPHYYKRMYSQLINEGIDENRIKLMDLSDPIFYPDVRYAYAGNCLDEIKEKGVKGDIAELGVYRGEFSSFLNGFMPERNIYLFDTFDGFPTEDGEYDKDVIFNDDYFSDTSIQTVLSNMPYKESCRIIKGKFPEVLKLHPELSEESKFSFVSIDADLYEPIYSGLNFFYDRLSPGGYIFVHDYGTGNWPGAKRAVELFCKERNIPSVPILDRGGTVIISKP